MIEELKELHIHFDTVDTDDIIEMWKKINELVKVANKPAEGNAEENSKYYNGRVMCIRENEDREFFTKGKIYPCINGYLIDNDEDTNNPFVPGMRSFAEICEACEADFIEVTGEVKIDD